MNESESKLIQRHWDDIRRRTGWGGEVAWQAFYAGFRIGRQEAGDHTATPPPVEPATTTPEPEPTPPSAIPELPAGTTPTVPGIYVVRHPRGMVSAYDIASFDFWKDRTECRFAGPIPYPSFARASARHSMPRWMGWIEGR